MDKLEVKTITLQNIKGAGKYPVYLSAIKIAEDGEELQVYETAINPNGHVQMSLVPLALQEAVKEGPKIGAVAQMLLDMASECDLFMPKDQVAIFNRHLTHTKQKLKSVYM